MTDSDNGEGMWTSFWRCPGCGSMAATDPSQFETPMKCAFVGCLDVEMEQSTREAFEQETDDA